MAQSPPVHLERRPQPVPLPRQLTKKLRRLPDVVKRCLVIGARCWQRLLAGAAASAVAPQPSRNVASSRLCSGSPLRQPASEKFSFRSPGAGDTRVEGLAIWARQTDPVGSFISVVGTAWPDASLRGSGRSGPVPPSEQPVCAAPVSRIPRGNRKTRKPNVNNG
jgi:hypothetical protein